MGCRHGFAPVIPRLLSNTGVRLVTMNLDDLRILEHPSSGIASWFNRKGGKYKVVVGYELGRGERREHIDEQLSVLLELTCRNDFKIPSIPITSIFNQPVIK